MEMGDPNEARDVAFVHGAAPGRQQVHHAGSDRKCTRLRADCAIQNYIALIRGAPGFRGVGEPSEDVESR